MSGYTGSRGGAMGVLRGPRLEKCPKCGYDLRGLMEGGKCPECGTDTARHEALGPRMGRESPLGAAPRGYLALLLIGFLLCSVGIAGREIWTIMGVFGAGASWSRFFIAAGMSAAWWLGALLLSVPRPHGTMTGADWDRQKEWMPLRWMVRGSIVAGVISAGSIELWIGGGYSVLMPIWGISEAFFIATVCWYAARVAEWAPDDGLVSRLRAVAWVVGAGTVGFGVAWGPRFGASLPLGMLTGVFVLMVVIGSLLGTVSMLQGANMVRWAIRNMDELRAREERIAARAERERLKGEAERAAMETVSAERMRLLDEVEAKHRAMEDTAVSPVGPAPGQDRVIARGADADAYGLEGDGESPKLL